MNHKPGQICQHCKTGNVCRPRGLCWRCYYAPGVKECYPSTSKHANRGYGLNQLGIKRPMKATTAPPGSAGKVAILEARAKRGEWLWHDGDAKDMEGANEQVKPPDRGRAGSYAGFFKRILASSDPGLDTAIAEPSDGDALD